MDGIYWKEEKNSATFYLDIRFKTLNSKIEPLPTNLNKNFILMGKET